MWYDTFLGQNTYYSDNSIGKWHCRISAATIITSIYKTDQG